MCLISRSMGICSSLYTADLHDLMEVDGVVPGGGSEGPGGAPRREEQELLKAQVLCHMSPYKRLVVALGQVGEGVGVAMDTLWVQVRWIHIAIVSACVGIAMITIFITNTLYTRQIQFHAFL